MRNRFHLIGSSQSMTAFLRIDSTCTKSVFYIDLGFFKFMLTHDQPVIPATTVRVLGEIEQEGILAVEKPAGMHVHPTGLYRY
jgi:hypothetical protein